MRKIYLFAIGMATLLSSCIKKDSTVNNYVPTQPSFAVNGITDVTFTNFVTYESLLSLTVQYLDSAQENVTLAVNNLPTGVTIDTTWIRSGIPTYNTTLTIFDTVGLNPGTYAVNLTATTASGKVKTYPFNIRILPMPTAFLGKYSNCSSGCGTGPYMDSVYADPNQVNKIWFTNFANSGGSVYGLLGPSETLTIPSQTVGGIAYSTFGTASVNLAGHLANFEIMRGSTTCFIFMH